MEFSLQGPQCDEGLRRQGGLLSVGWRRLGFLLCAGVMVLCLALQGILLYGRDAATPDPLPLAFMLSDWVWLALAVSFVFYFKKPIVTVVAGWLAILILLVLFERFSHQDSLFSLWYDRLLMPIFITASHVGFFLRRGSVQAPRLK